LGSILDMKTDLDSQFCEGGAVVLNDTATAADVELYLNALFSTLKDKIFEFPKLLIFIDDSFKDNGPVMSMNVSSLRARVRYSTLLNT
jgi:hypothetical protein